jgi:putative membrane protein
VDVRSLFKERDLEAIRAAASSAEARTSGEIVAYVVGQCDRYEGARYRAIAGAAVLAALAAGTLHATGDFWGGWGLFWISLPVALRRALILEGTLERRVAQRAAAAFLEEEVFNTRDRTGILIFLALFEHRVLVLADSGIRAKVPESEWKLIADELAGGIREHRPAEALITALARCGRLLEEQGVERRVDDRDELSNAVRLRYE